MCALNGNAASGTKRSFDQRKCYRAVGMKVQNNIHMGKLCHVVVIDLEQKGGRLPWQRVSAFLQFCDHQGQIKSEFHRKRDDMR